MQHFFESPKKWTAAIFITILLQLCFAGKNEFLIRSIYDSYPIRRYPDKVIEHIKVGKASGYNCLITNDMDYENLEKSPVKLITNFKRVQAVAQANGIKLIPWHFYQQQPAHENYSLAEAFPVKGTKFVVANSEARAVGDHSIGLDNGGFESFTGGVPDHWKLILLDPGKCRIDQDTKRSGKASLYVQGAGADARITQRIQLRPFRAYEISAWFRTKNMKHNRDVQFRMDRPALYRRDLAFSTPAIWTTLRETYSTWAKCVIDFNSLECASANLSLFFANKHPQVGVDSLGDTTWVGEIWVDDIQVREVGLYETVRHRTKPIVVKSEEGKIVYVEGKDYLVDPKCNAPFTADSYWYEGHLTIPEKSAIRDGQKLRVDWYQYANTETQIPESDFCLPESWAELSTNLSHIDKLYGHQDAMFCNIDEWRVAGWNEQCEAFKFRTAGEYMAQTWQRIESMLRGPVNESGNGCRKVITVSDMFDPYHNAVPHYASCKGGNKGSWNNLGENVIILNWNLYHDAKYTRRSLKFFAGQDVLAPNLRCKQLVQSPGPSYANIWSDTLTNMEKDGFDGVVGMNFVNWDGDYSSIPATAAAYKAKGRWPTNPFPTEWCEPKTDIIANAGPVRRVGRLFSSSKGNHNHVIEFTVPENAEISLKVFNLHGRHVQSLAAGKTTAGTHRIGWNTAALSSGIYFLRLSGKNMAEKTVKQMVF